MDATVDAIQNVVAVEPEATEHPNTAQIDDAAIEAGIAQEINELWSSHVRLSGERRTTQKELRHLRARLAERLYAMKSLLARPGRGGEWRGWLREHGIPRSSADRLVARYAESLGADRGEELHTEAIPESPDDNAEKLANSVWQRFRKVLATDDAVARFIGRIAELSGIRHERRDEGLVIFNPVPKAADAAGPAPQTPDEGDANQADPQAVDQGPNPSDDASTLGTQESSGDVTTTTVETGTPQELSQEAAATPPEAGEAAAVADAGGGAVA